MPKMKTKSSAKKRFKLTGTGKLKRRRAYQSHLQQKKSAKRKRSLRQNTTVNKSFEKRVKSMLAG